MLKYRSGNSNLSISNAGAILLAMLVIFTNTASAWACGVCGCEEVCPLTMIDADEINQKPGGAGSDSIVGNMVLKLAFQRDPVLRKLVWGQKFARDTGVNAVSLV